MLSPLIALALALAAGSPLPQPVEWTVAAYEGGGGRVLFVRDPVLLEVARDPEFQLDYAVTVRADETGRVAHELLGNGWAYCPYRSDRARTAILTGRGFHSLFVNGDRFAGDFYRLGVLRLAVPLRKGMNHLLVRGLRGEFTLRLEAAEGTCSLSPRDPVLPELRRGTLVTAPGAVLLLNHTGVPLRGAALTVGDGKVFARVTVGLDPVLPYGLAKPPFPLKQLREPGPEELDEKGRYLLPVALRQGAAEVAGRYPVPVRDPGDAYVETRLSGIDGSVQLHAVRPPVRIEAGRRYALYLTLHGAGVVAGNQARAYRGKRDAFVVAPTNRRRYGFDWQDWGRLDALETLEFALRTYPIDPARVYLTGHSMGGHGAWYLGALHPWRFAAVCPSAGWESFFTYGGGMPRSFGDSPELEPFGRTHLESDTGAILPNLAGTPMYVLHGEADDNVPVAESRRLVGRLGEFHEDFVYHEQPGAGHWWGDECVDWNPLFEFCRRHVRVERPLSFRFTTVNPAVAGRYAWATIRRQVVPAAPSTIEVEADPRAGTVAVGTGNVAELELDLAGVVPQEEVTLTVDGRSFDSEPKRILLVREGAEASWAVGRRPDPALRSPLRGGPFKLAWRNRMVWVYGTRGTPEENAATLAKVRYDAEVWWYRGNGSPRIVPDREFDPALCADRNVILYGNADTNSAFRAALGEAPLAIRRGEVRIGDEVYEGDLGLFLVYPRIGSDEALVGVVGATSARMMRIAQQARYFVSGTAVPDWVLWTPDTLRKGMGGVLRSGYFDDAWRIPRKGVAAK